MRAIFCIPWSHEQHLPPMEELHYTDEEGILRGGYSVIGHVPYTETLLIWIEASEDMVNQMAESDDYLYIGDVPDDEEAV